MELDCEHQGSVVPDLMEWWGVRGDRRGDWRGGEGRKMRGGRRRKRVAGGESKKEGEGVDIKEGGGNRDGEKVYVIGRKEGGRGEK